MKLLMSVYKYITTSVKEPTSLLRLLWSDSSVPWLDRPWHQRKTPNRVGLLLSHILHAPFATRWDGANRYILWVRGKSDPYYPIAPTPQSHRRRSKAYPTLQRVMSTRCWDSNPSSLTKSWHFKALCWLRESDLRWGSNPRLISLARRAQPLSHIDYLICCCCCCHRCCCCHLLLWKLNVAIIVVLDYVLCLFYLCRQKNAHVSLVGSTFFKLKGSLCWAAAFYIPLVELIVI